MDSSNMQMNDSYNYYNKQNIKNWRYTKSADYRYQIAIFAQEHSIQAAMEKYRLSSSSIYKY